MASQRIAIRTHGVVVALILRLIRRAPPLPTQAERCIMKNHYILSGGERYQVSKDIYNGINQTTNRIYYRRSRAEQCRATKGQRSRCEGDCSSCPGYIKNETDIDDTWLVSRRALTASAPDSMEELAYCADILDAMQEADPDGRRIGRLYLLRCKDVDIAQILGISKSAYYRRKRKIKAHLRKYLAQDNI